MVNKKNIYDFINYNYVPFEKSQCIKRIFVFWILSAMVCLIGNRSVAWILPLAIINLLLSVLFICMIIKHNKKRISRYLCDGLFYFYIAVCLNLSSYRVFVLQIGSNPMLFLLFILLLLLFIFVFTLITFINIKQGKYAMKVPSTRFISLPFFCGAIGIFFTRLLLQGQSQEVVFSVVSYILLILSFLLGIPSINLLKATLYMVYSKR